MTTRPRKPSTPATTNTTPEETKVTAPTVPTAKKRTRTLAPRIDLTALTVESAPQPVKQGAVSSADNPATGWLRKSWNEKQATGPGTFRGSGQQVKVPVANKTMVENLIRSAAAAMGKTTGERIGVAIQVVDAGEGMVYVRFAAKTQKAPVKKA